MLVEVERAGGWAQAQPVSGFFTARGALLGPRQRELAIGRKLWGLAFPSS